MGFCLCMGALASCSAFGAAPTPLTFLPSTIMGSAGPIGTMPDCIPFANITPFGVCRSILNPTTAALTAAALGVLTPGPCIPTPAGAWIPTKPTVMSAKGPTISNDAMLMCAYGGQIKALVPGQFTAMM
ncbi:MAG: DUF4280 domain-containing protein [Holosporaceae bacterium]|nr:DUF4280 domain-containing protein [Holosporaceae bacterium]